MAENIKSGRTALIEPLSVDCIALDAAPVGTVDDSVTRWLAAGVFINGAIAATNVGVASYITAPDSATAGTIFTFRTPGVYYAEAGFPAVAATTLLAGISKGGVAGAFTGNPALGVNGVVAVIGPNLMPAATTVGLYIGKVIQIFDADLGTANAQIRFLLTDGAGGTPIAGVVEGGAWASITRLADHA